MSASSRLKSCNAMRTVLDCAISITAIVVLLSYFSRGVKNERGQKHNQRTFRQRLELAPTLGATPKLSSTKSAHDDNTTRLPSVVSGFLSRSPTRELHGLQGISIAKGNNLVHQSVKGSVREASDACAGIRHMTREAISRQESSHRSNFLRFVQEQRDIKTLPGFITTFAHTRTSEYRWGHPDILRTSSFEWAQLGEGGSWDPRNPEWEPDEAGYWHWDKADELAKIRKRPVKLWHPPGRDAPFGFPWLRKTPVAPRQVIMGGGNKAFEFLHEALDETNRSILAYSNDTASQFRTLAISGTDKSALLDTNYSTAILKSAYFGKILVEPYDQRVDGVQVCPIGFTVQYTVFATPRVIVQALVNTSISTKNHTRGVLASWGKVWKGLDDGDGSRKRALAWLSRPTTTVASHRELLPQPQYYERLKTTRFLIAPRGSGVQSPKIMEALLMLVVPIVERDSTVGDAAFEDLVGLGYPLVLVDSWDVVTEPRLERWWKQLSPLLEDARWMLLRDMWTAFVLHPCPGTIRSFVQHVRSGQCPPHRNPTAKQCMPEKPTCRDGACYVGA
eukprot:m.1397384 g.1397384  ORF g.1397384 m.1397384 type:complete len:562 (+) comp24997_c1_seq8:50-1735(+)